MKLIYYQKNNQMIPTKLENNKYIYSNYLLGCCYILINLTSESSGCMLDL